MERRSWEAWAMGLKSFEAYRMKPERHLLRQKLVSLARERGLKAATRVLGCSRNTARKWVRRNPNPRVSNEKIHPRSRIAWRLHNVWCFSRGGGGAIPRFATERIFPKHGRWKGRARPPAEPPHPSCRESGISIRPLRSSIDDEKGCSLKIELIRGFGSHFRNSEKPAGGSSGYCRAKRRQPWLVRRMPASASPLHEPPRRWPRRDHASSTRSSRTLENPPS